MARVHEIGIAANTREFERAISDGVIDPVKDAERAFEKLEDAVGDTGTGGERDIEKLEDALKGAQKETDQLARKTGDVGDFGRKGFGKAKAASGEFKQEALSNFSEVTSSFDGSMSSIQDLAQGTLGGLAATDLPGVGLAAGLAAIAVGSIAEGIGQSEEAARKAKEEAARWAEGFAASGGRIVDTATVVGGILDQATDPEKYETARQAGEEWGVDISYAMRALAGDGTALEIVERSLRDRAAESAAALAEQEKQTTSSAGAAFDMADSVDKGRQRFDELTTAMQTGRQWAKDNARALAGYTQEVGTATGKTDDLGNSVYTLPDGKEVVVDVRTGEAYEDLDAFERRKLTQKRVGVVVEVDTSAWENWRPKTKNGIVVSQTGNKNWQIG
ncbi:hypothetical protein [uncultured Microbacterium sp.]|uniref:Uncharacterized protein n=1 Tax=uncultured Microbacterium sp. TaxID=191216 RepID=A0A1Y5NWI4_9MICO|nr:hypothetical protein [uncultured Microbacterium sp.]SBS70786.1 hypothetical protein MIPYR_10650 [uncultured Microbacterium sp.]